VQQGPAQDGERRGDAADLADVVDDDGVGRPVEAGRRVFGHSKNFRTAPQVVIAMAVTREGVPGAVLDVPG